MQKNIINQNFSHEITGIFLSLLNKVTNNEREIVNLENRIREQIKLNMDNIELSTVDRPEVIKTTASENIQADIISVMNTAVRAQQNYINALEDAVKDNESKLSESFGCSTKPLSTDLQSKLNNSGFGENKLKCTNKSFITQVTEIVKKHFGNQTELMSMLNVLPGSEEINQNK